METHARHQEDFIKSLIAQKHNIGFYQLVRLLHNYCNNKTVAFAANTDLAFPGMDVSNIINTQTSITLKQNLFNLAGQNGILPDHVTENLLQLLEEKDPALLDFLNVFTNNLVEKYYEAWSCGQFYIRYEQQQHDSWSDYSINLLGSLLGLDTKVANQQLAQNTYLHYAGILSQNVRTKQGLQAILSDFFNLPISIQEFDGRWVDIKPNERTCLGSKNGNYNSLGMNSMLGERIWHIQNSFRIIVGILDYTDFLKLLPNQQMLQTMKEIVKFYCGAEYDFNIEIIINHKTIPYCQLRRNQQVPYQLGWTSWLKTKSQPETNPSVQFRINN